MDRNTEDEFETLCRNLSHSTSGLIELKFTSHTWGNRMVIDVRFRTSAVEGVDRIMILERLCERDLKRLSDAKRQFKQLADRLNVDLQIRE